MGLTIVRPRDCIVRWESGVGFVCVENKPPIKLSKMIYHLMFFVKQQY